MGTAAHSHFSFLFSWELQATEQCHSRLGRVFPPPSETDGGNPTQKPHKHAQTFSC